MTTKIVGPIGLALTISLFATGGAIAQQPAGTSATLSAKDRADIQHLVAEYARTLGDCVPEEFVSLFEAPNGFFESVSRGRVLGRARLLAFIHSEQQCEKPAASRDARTVPTTVIEVSDLGVTGKADLGAIGHYEDVYVKTAAGWRFRSRNYVNKKAVDAKFTFQDFAQLRRLAGDEGQFEDVYIESPRGLIFRQSGMTIDPVSPGEATGKVHLKDDDGHYEDVYVKTSRGWRFTSRTYVPTDPVTPFQRDSRSPR